MADTNEIRKLSPALKAVLDNVPKVHDANGTLDLGITAIGFLEAILRENLMTVARLTAWLNENVVVGRDVGPGAEQESANLFSGLLTSLRKGQTGAGGGGNVDPVQTGTRPLTYDWPTAVAYAEDGYHYDGTQGVSAEELVLRKETLSYGLPTTWSDFEPSVPRALFLSNTVTSLLGGTDAAYRLDDGNGTPMTGQQILDEQRAVRGGGRGPSGDGGSTEAGPGVVS